MDLYLMPRDRLTFRQRDITAAIKAIEATGKQVARVEVTHDGFNVYPGTPVDESAGPAITDVEREFRERMRKHDEERAKRKQGKA